MADPGFMIDAARSRTTGERKEPSYIIHLETGVDKGAHFDALRPHLHGHSHITEDYEYLNAYTGTFDEEALDFLRASDDVEKIEKDAVLSLFDEVMDEV
ncbi:hypothetical protein D9611_005856 [Ephemerocybe angulata]|uniref:Inhibitor I9 domain-containing protein n=1 Tax=Ephemerocybe angulata TaxID=980116 RepID=A0A8H5FLL0_9AGAR|nr:hypothetical protein D9611_005856 [Tulosesus angulatus]